MATRRYMQCRETTQFYSNRKRKNLLSIRAYNNSVKLNQAQSLVMAMKDMGIPEQTSRVSMIRSFTLPIEDPVRKRQGHRECRERSRLYNPSRLRNWCQSALISNGIRSN